MDLNADYSVDALNEFKSCLLKYDKKRESRRVAVNNAKNLAKKFEVTVEFVYNNVKGDLKKIKSITCHQAGSKLIVTMTASDSAQYCISAYMNESAFFEGATEGLPAFSIEVHKKSNNELIAKEDYGSYKEKDVHLRLAALIAEFEEEGIIAKR